MRIDTPNVVFCDLCHVVIEGEVCWRNDLMVCQKCCAFLAPKKTASNTATTILKWILGAKLH
jgi:hypothetical protein